ncbi:MAG: DNA repair protein RecO [Bacteroidia bacterium]|nr:DNA repair protein RecO [Bacteroidia bacterium]
MIHTTEGIVLRTVRHQDSNLIATLYTRDFGPKSFIVKGFRSMKARRSHSFFQPLSIVEVVFVNKETRSVQPVSETRSAVWLQSLQQDPVKLSLGLSMLEIFSDTVREESPNPPHYDFLRETLLSLDRSDQRLIQIFLWFLVHHTRFLGFFPNDCSQGAACVAFDPVTGLLTPAADSSLDTAALLRQFLYATLDPLPEPQGCQTIRFDALRKRSLIRLIFEYYAAHVTGFQYPQTMKVFSEVFGGAD